MSETTPDAEDIRKTLTSVEQTLTPTDPELVTRGLAGDPAAIRRLRQQRTAVEHVVEARRLLREVSDGE